MNDTISLIIPVYRSSASLRELYSRIVAALNKSEFLFEIIFIEDCGGDAAWEVICSLAAADPKVKGIQMSRNFGQHNALLAGIRAASGRFIITLDDDLQHPPEEIQKLLNKLNEGYDVVYGTPTSQRHSTFRNIASQITKLALQGAMGAETAMNVSALRIFRTNLREGFSDYQSPSVNIDVLLTWSTTRFSSVAVKHDIRRHGESGYTIRKLLRHAMNMMTGFSTIPLKIASIVGIFFACIGALVFVYVLIRYFTTQGGTPGFPFLASIIAIFSGAQLLALGVMGEYLGRIHLRTMNRPPYLIGKKTESKG